MWSLAANSTLTSNQGFVYFISFSFCHAETDCLWRSSSRTWPHPISWLRVETLLQMLQPLEDPLLLHQHNMLWNLHCHGMGMWICRNSILPHLVHHTIPPYVGHRTQDRWKAVGHDDPRLLRPMLRIIWLII